MSKAEGELNLSDPFERAVMDLVEMNRRKRADYSATGGIWWNFDQTARLTGASRAEVIWTNVCQKVNRLVSLRGREPKNESVVDTKLDLAVYAILLYTEAAGYGTEDDAKTDRYDVMDGAGRKVGEL